MELYIQNAVRKLLARVHIIKREQLASVTAVKEASRLLRSVGHAVKVLHLQVQISA